jgi:hypothetical protein
MLWIHHARCNTLLLLCCTLFASHCVAMPSVCALLLCAVLLRLRTAVCCALLLGEHGRHAMLLFTAFVAVPHCRG